MWKGKDDFIIHILTSEMFFKNLVWELKFIDLILVFKVVWSEFVCKTVPYFSEGWILDQLDKYFFKFGPIGFHFTLNINAGGWWLV